MLTGQTGWFPTRPSMFSYCPVTRPSPEQKLSFCFKSRSFLKSDVSTRSTLLLTLTPSGQQCTHIDRPVQVPTTLVVLLLLIWLKRLLEETWQLRRICPRRIANTVPIDQHEKAPEGDTASRRNCHGFYAFLVENGSFHAFLDWLYLAISGCALYFLWSFEPYPLRRSLETIRGKLRDDVQLVAGYASISNRPLSTHTHTQRPNLETVPGAGSGNRR